VIREEGGEAVVMQIYDALRLAEQEGIDLVEVSPNQSPPVCRLLDYGKFRFIQAKKAREVKKGQKLRNEMREVRLTPGIAEHDIDSKIRSVAELLDDGAKVRVAVFFRGRQITHPELAVRVLRRVAEAVAAKAKLERAPLMEGRALSIILAPAGQQSRPVEAAAGAGAPGGVPQPPPAGAQAAAVDTGGTPQSRPAGTGGD
jgi:translation initiation factor IF-3